MKTNELPTKPIEKIHIMFSGDPSVGIRACSFCAEIYIDIPNGYFEDPLKSLDELRSSIGAIYETMCGGNPVVLFDYELARLEAADKASQEIQP